MTEARAVAERIAREISERTYTEIMRAHGDWIRGGPGKFDHGDEISIWTRAITEALTTAHAAGRHAMREEAATAVEDATRAPPQRNAKDQWIEQIGQRAAAAVRALKVEEG